MSCGVINVTVPYNDVWDKYRGPANIGGDVRESLAGRQTSLTRIVPSRRLRPVPGL